MPPRGHGEESQIRIVHVDLPEDLKIRAQEVALN